MYILTAIIIGLSTSLTAIAATYLVSRRRIFQESFEILEKHRDLARPRKKSELRRYKKIRTLVRKAKRNILILFFIHLAIFISTYTTAIVLTGLLVPEDKQLVTTPIALPIFSAKTDGMYMTHILFITFIAYIAPSYLLIRAVRKPAPTETIR